ncbi:DUF4136 domain-containing protein [Photobacterium sp. CCB-ST2H9]|uniref:DUF4136 domain-containing protein n=1 Tax=unclassified Photobacterium TaxID=2628852 RepID=UPI0020033E09|nr:DUF4136 domain-containing protein [Photobacterium sp. CCB-ST2H9]UTM59821.1 DUF4136 domain-containing protein [Photobacterium sp. CCB-ST2H9]
MRALLSLVPCFLILLGGCSAKVATDYNASVDFSQYHTYQFAEVPQSSIVSLDKDRLEETIKRELRYKGLQPAEGEGKADLTVNPYIREMTDFDSYGTSVGFGVGYRYSSIAYSTPVRFREYTYGKLIVELIDNKTNKVIWRSISRRQLSESMTPSARQSFIQEQVGEMFAQYPPSRG